MGLRLASFHDEYCNTDLIITSGRLKPPDTLMKSVWGPQDVCNLNKFKC